MEGFNSLQWASCLEETCFSIHVKECSNLVDISGFNGLMHLGTLSVHNNGFFVQISGFQSLVDANEVSINQYNLQVGSRSSLPSLALVLSRPCMCVRVVLRCVVAGQPVQPDHEPTGPLGAEHVLPVGTNSHDDDPSVLCGPPARLLSHVVLHCCAFVGTGERQDQRLVHEPPSVQARLLHGQPASSHLLVWLTCLCVGV